MDEERPGFLYITFKLFCKLWVTRVAQSVKHPTLDFYSGHDLTVCGVKPSITLCVDSMEPAWDSLPLSLSAPLLLSLSQNKKVKKNTFQ